MEIKKRLFPYPVLSEDSDDYIDSSFNVEAKMLDNNLNNIKLSFSMTLDNKGLKHLIDK